VKVPDLRPLAAGVGVAVGVGDVPPEGGAPEGVVVAVGLAEVDVDDGATAALGSADGGVRKLTRRITPTAVATRVTAARTGMTDDLS
jgi:hypothetical protein